MNDLLQRLEAAIAETERIALATESLEWIARLEHGDADVAEKDSGYLVAAYREVYPECAISLDDDVAVHIAHNDPKRVLRRVARDRKLLALHVIYDVQPPDSFWKRGAHLCEVCSRTCDGELIHDEGPVCATLMLLAEDYEIQVES